MKNSEHHFASLLTSHVRTDPNKTDLPSMYNTPGHNNVLQELPAGKTMQELPSNHVPVRELASLEVPTPVYELPSPIHSPRSIHSKPSIIKTNGEPNAPANVSPLAGPYTPDTPGAVSEISILEIGTRHAT